MLWNHITDRHIASGSRRRKHKGARLNLVGDYRVFRLVELLYADNTDYICAGSADIGAHTVEKIRHVHDVRLLGRILNRRLTFRQGCRHHNIDGSPH